MTRTRKKKKKISEMTEEELAEFEHKITDDGKRASKTMRELRDKVYAECGEDIIVGRVSLFDIISRDRRLYETLANYMIYMQCRDQMRTRGQEMRRERFHSPPRPKYKDHKKRLAATATYDSDSIMLTQLPLPGQPRLHDSNKKMVMLAKEHYFNTAQDASLKSRWYSLIEERLP